MGDFTEKHNNNLGMRQAHPNTLVRKVLFRNILKL